MTPFIHTCTIASLNIITHKLHDFCSAEFKNFRINSTIKSLRSRGYSNPRICVTYAVPVELRDLYPRVGSNPAKDRIVHRWVNSVP